MSSFTAHLLYFVETDHKSMQQDRFFLPKTRLDAMQQKGYFLWPMEVLKQVFQTLTEDKGRLVLPFLFLLGLAEVVSMFGYWAVWLLNVFLDPFVVAFVLFQLMNKRVQLQTDFAGLIKARWQALLGMNLLYYLILLVIASPIIFTLWNYNILDQFDQEGFDINAALEALPERISMIFSIILFVILFLLISFWWSTILVLFFDLNPVQAIQKSFLLVNKRLGRQINIALFIGLIFLLIQTFIASFIGLPSWAQKAIGLVSMGFLNVYIYIMIFETFAQAYFYLPVVIKKKEEEESRDQD